MIRAREWGCGLLIGGPIGLLMLVGVGRLFWLTVFIVILLALVALGVWKSWELATALLDARGDPVDDEDDISTHGVLSGRRMR